MGFLLSLLNIKFITKAKVHVHIDWKLYAKTDKLYTKRYDDETNLRCHIIIDNSSSMHYPEMHDFSIS